MKIFSFKKGTDVIENWIFWILFALAVGVVGIIIYNTANAQVAEASKIPEDLEDELILASRFYNSEDCFAYQDKLGRVYTKVINSSEFTQENLDKCFSKGDIWNKVKYAYLLTLEQPFQGIGPIWTFNTLPIKTFNYPEEGYAQKAISEDVRVLYEDKTYNGKLRIKIKDVE